MKNNFEVFLENKPVKDHELSTHISIKNKYVFVQISKAASSSVKWALQSLEFKSSPWNVQDVNNKFYSPHLSPYQLSETANNDVFFSKEYKRTTFVRNPFTRLLSCYLHRVVAKPRSATNKAVMKLTGGRGGADVSFNEFIELICSQKSVDQESHWRCQYEDLCLEKVNYDFIGKLENIDSDLPNLLEFIYGKMGKKWYLKSIKEDASPMKTGSNEKLVKYYTDDMTVKRVVQRYEADFETFKYSTNLFDE